MTMTPEQFSEVLTRIMESKQAPDRAIANSSKVQLSLTISLCVGMAALVWSVGNVKADAMKEIREQYVNKDLFNAKFDTITGQFSTMNEKLSELKVEVSALRLTGEKR